MEFKFFFYSFLCACEVFLIFAKKTIVWYKYLKLGIVHAKACVSVE